MIGKRLAASFLCLSLAGLAACSKEQPKSDVMVEGAKLADCGDARADTKHLKALRKSDDRLRKALDDGAANAITEAHRALDAGDYRLAAATTAKGIATEPYGAQCRVLGGLQPWTVRSLAFISEGAIPAENEMGGAVTGFGRRYNAVLLADPRYPYADICRPVEKAGAKPKLADDPDAAVDQPYGFSQLGIARMAHGLGAAARRGSEADIQKLIQRGQNVNAPDLFGLTPLAWAIAYHRWPAAQALLKAKASPKGAACQSTIDRESPMQVARVMRWYGVIRAMRPLVTEDEFASLRQKPRYVDASLNEFNHAFSELKDRYEAQLRRQPFARRDMNFEVDKSGATTSCKLDPGSSSPAFDKELCGLAVEIIHWTPARDAFGTRVPETAKLVVGFGGES